MKKIINSIILIVIFIFCSFILICNYYIIHYRVDYDLENFSIKKLNIHLKNVSAAYRGTSVDCEKVLLEIKKLFPFNIVSKIDNLNIKNKYFNAFSKRNSIEYNYKKGAISANLNSIYIKNYEVNIQNLNVKVENGVISGKFLIPNKVTISKNFLLNSITDVKFDDFILFSLKKSSTPIIELKSSNIETKVFTIKSFYSVLKILDKNKNILDILCLLNKNSNINIHGIISSFSPFNGDINCKLQNVRILELYLKKLSSKSKVVDFIFNITGLNSNKTIKNYDIKVRNGKIKVYD